MPAKVDGEGELYRKFKGQPFVELEQRSPFAQVAILGDECLELCECARLIVLIPSSVKRQAEDLSQEEGRQGGREGKDELDSSQPTFQQSLDARKPSVLDLLPRFEISSRTAMVSSGVVEGSLLWEFYRPQTKLRSWRGGDWPASVETKRAHTTTSLSPSATKSHRRLPLIDGLRHPR